MLCGNQIRGARGLLGISQEQLAKLARVGVATVRRMEAVDGLVPGNVETAARVRNALEGAGIIFIDATEDSGAGVRLRKHLRS